MRPDVVAPGSLIDLRGRRWRVTRVVGGAGDARLEVACRNRQATLLLAFERIGHARRRRRPARARAGRALARLASLMAYEGDAAWVAATVRSTFSPLPYQLEPAAAMATGVRRILLTDEVGLGKTIQAGLIVAHRMQLDPDARILVLTPAGLRDQWADELTRRFDLRVEVGDRDGLDAAARTAAFGANPWQRRGVWMATLDFLKQPHVRAGLPWVIWDLVVVDEAHDACGDSDRHDVCAELARRARRLLLLTATPHSGDETRFSRLVSLGALSPRDTRMVVWRRTRSSLALGRTRVVRWLAVRGTPRTAALMSELAAFEREMKIRSASDRSPSWHLLAALLRKRALSTLRAFALTCERRRRWLQTTEAQDDVGATRWRQLTLAFDAAADVMSTEDLRGVTARSGLNAHDELPWLLRLEEMALAAHAADPKIDRLRRLLARTEEPVVVFTEFVDSLEAIRDALPADLTCACLHGGLSDRERRLALSDFLDGPARVLLTTDVGGQGLNLQGRARWVVNLELPWTPTRLEQRAGRVDRIGQASRAHVSVLIARDYGESEILTRLTARAHAASEAVEATLPHGGFRPAGARWAVVGAAAACDLARRRALLGAIRQRESVEAGRAWVSPLRGAAIGRIAPQGSVLVFSVPIAAHDGSLRHQAVVPVAADTAGADGTRLAHAEGAALVSASRLARRLTARGRRRGARDMRIDRAIVHACELHAASAGAQPGLFDQRAARTRDQAAQQLADLRQHIEQRAASLTSACEAAQPSLQVLLCRTR